MAGDGSLGLMSRRLRGLGYRTYRSLMHANVGCTQEASETLERRIEAIALRRGRKVTVVGHSLGGLMARGLAGKRPDLVDGIVTLGSPILAPGAAHPILLFDLKMVTRLQRAGLGRLMGEDCTSGELRPGELGAGPGAAGPGRVVHLGVLPARRDRRLAQLPGPAGLDRGGRDQPPRHGVRPGGARPRL